MQVVATNKISTCDSLIYAYFFIIIILCLNLNSIAEFLLIDTTDSRVNSKIDSMDIDDEYHELILSDDIIIAFIYGYNKDMIVDRINISSGKSKRTIIQFNKSQYVNWWYRPYGLLKDKIPSLSRLFSDNGDVGLFLSCIPYYIAYTDNLSLYEFYNILSGELNTINTGNSMTPIGLLTTPLYLFIQTSEIVRYSNRGADRYVVYDLEKDSGLSSTIVEYSNDSFFAQYVTLDRGIDYFALIGTDVDSMQLVIYLFHIHPLTLLDSILLPRNDIRKTSAYIDLTDKHELHLCVDKHPYFYRCEIDGGTNKFGSIAPDHEMKGVMSGNENIRIHHSKYYTAWINKDNKPVFHIYNKADGAHKEYDLTEYGFTSKASLSYYLEERSGKVVFWYSREYFDRLRISR